MSNVSLIYSELPSSIPRPETQSLYDHFEIRKSLGPFRFSTLWCKNNDDFDKDDDDKLMMLDIWWSSWWRWWIFHGDLVMIVMMMMMMIMDSSSGNLVRIGARIAWRSCGRSWDPLWDKRWCSTDKATLRQEMVVLYRQEMHREARQRPKILL